MSPTVPQPDCPDAARIHEVVAMVHVLDVDRSNEFYSWLGFQCDSRFSSESGITNWSSLSSGKGRLMLARATAPVVASEQAVLFYMYSENVRALREHLIAKGLPNAGPPPGELPSPPPPAGAVVYDIVPRFYMPMGELRIHDPDGYVILVGQLG
jgi:hypothetical protein